MEQKTRLIILAICAVLFLSITPYIVLYSLGYRVDLGHWKITATGGMYIKAFPTGATIAIDNKPQDSTGLFSNYAFEQNLLPGSHSVSIKDPGYYNYQKTLPVTQYQVTKLEHVVLFKQNIPYTLLDGNASNFYLAPDGKTALAATSAGNAVDFKIINLDTQEENNAPLSVAGKSISAATWSADSTRALVTVNNTYFLLQPFLPAPSITGLPYLTGASQVSFNPQDASQIAYLKNNNLYENTKTLPVAQNTITYQISGDDIIYLSSGGLLYDFDTINSATSQMSSQDFPVDKTATYAIKDISGNLFLEQNNSWFLFNQNTKTFENFYVNASGLKMSPDGQKILLYGGSKIAYASLSDLAKPIILGNFSSQITSAYWLNSDYIIINTGGKIIISETDVRGNINTIMLPQTISVAGQNLTLSNPQIFFNQQDKKLYILTGNNFIVSEPLLP